MNETLQITKRIDVALNVLNAINFQGFHEISAVAPAVAKAMQIMAAISQDIQKFEQEQKKKEEEPEAECEECMVHYDNEGEKNA